MTRSALNRTGTSAITILPGLGKHCRWAPGGARQLELPWRQGVAWLWWQANPRAICQSAARRTERRLAGTDAHPTWEPSGYRSDLSRWPPERLSTNDDGMRAQLRTELNPGYSVRSEFALLFSSYAHVSRPAGLHGALLGPAGRRIRVYYRGKPGRPRRAAGDRARHRWPQPPPTHDQRSP